MNERLKELAIQAGFFYEDYKDIWYLEYHNETCEEEMKKFAELIIQECLDKVDKTGSHFNEQPQYNDKQNALVSEGFFWALESVKQQIKQHFGVEE